MAAHGILREESKLDDIVLLGHSSKKLQVKNTRKKTFKFIFLFSFIYSRMSLLVKFFDIMAKFICRHRRHVCSH